MFNLYIELGIYRLVERCLSHAFLRRFRSSPPPKRPYLSSVQRLMLTRERIRLSDLLDRQAINPKPADCFEF